MDGQSLAGAWNALLFGALSASSLLAGAWVGMIAKPARRLSAAIMAFGAGALFAALSLELVGEALERLDGGFWPVGVGCVAGGLAFVLLDKAVNSGGGALRKRSTLARQLVQIKKRDTKRIIAGLCKVPIFASLPPEEVRALVGQVERMVFPRDAQVMAEGEEGRELFIVEEGELAVSKAGVPVAKLGKDQVVGEMALLTGERRSADVKAAVPSTLLVVHKADFDRLLGIYPRLKAEVESMTQRRRADLELVAAIDPEEWTRRAERSTEGLDRATDLDLDAAWSEASSMKESKKGGAPMAIWVGILIDGIPESAVIGASMIGGTTVSFALILGLFISNFPEAMSSAMGMRKMGMGKLRITLLWLSIVALTALGAALGNLSFRDASPELVSLFESLAAGAMLAMLAETMMPEAYEQGGSITGISTILGFLAALFMRTLQ